MNVRRDHFVKPLVRAGATRRAARLLGCASLALFAGACVSANPFATAKVDPTSPIASGVTGSVRANRGYPKFSDIPRVPADTRPLAAWGQAAAGVKDAGERLEAETGPENWTLGGTEGFAAGAKAAAGPENAPGATEQADTEAFARALRERATPPPSPR